MVCVREPSLNLMANLTSRACSGLGSFQQGVRSAGQTDEHTVASLHFPARRISHFKSAPGNTAGWGKIFKVKPA
jgi:hypothetical protein